MSTGISLDQLKKAAKCSYFSMGGHGLEPWTSCV